MNSMKQTVITNQTWWNRCSAHERGLTALTVSRLLWCIALIVGITLNMPMSVGCMDDYTRNLLGRAHAASEVLKNMNPEIDPCDNFYEFACGGFLKATSIYGDNVSMNMFTIAKDNLQDQLALSVEENIELTESKPFRLVKTLYKTCKDTDTIEKHGLKPIHDLLERLGGWPVMNSGRWNGSDFDWKNLTYKFHEEGLYMNYFIKFGIDCINNSTIYVISLDQPMLGLPREYLTKGFNDQHVQTYYKYIVDVAVIMGAKEDHAMKEMEKALLFEIQLANISLPNKNRQNRTQMFNLMTITELARNYPSVPWRTYFTKLLSPSIDVEEDEIANVRVPSYISDFEKLISSTPKVIQANYIMWRLVQQCITYLNEEIRKRQLVHSTDLNKRLERVTRTEECLGKVTKHLIPAVNAMYVRKYFNEEVKKNANEMVMYIRQQLTKILEQVEWMDEQTRQSALEKAAAMSSYVAYPDELLDDDKLETYYSNLDLSKDNYLELILKLTRFTNEKTLSKLRKPVNKLAWENYAHSATMNALYILNHNSILIPAGILQGVFFNKDRPRYMNYGAIGFLIGHEITHGFDWLGRKYSKDGNLIDFWTPSTEQKYLEKTKCIIQQYGNYTVEKVRLKLNGITTQNSNIADNAGIKLAYRAYNDWVARNREEQRLPRLENYTPNQMFWISSANMMCTKSSLELLIHQIKTYRYSPNEFRVIGSLSNMPEFAKDFDCPIGSKMNPENKCLVW